MAKVPHAAAKVYPKGGKTVHLCFWAMSGITAKGPVAMVETARRRKGVPQRRENGSPLQPGNAGNHRYRPCGRGQGRTPLQRCTQKAGKRFTFASGQCRESPLKALWQWQERTPLQRCTLKAGKRFTFATGQCRERRYRPCGYGLERTPLQRCTLKAGKRFTFATGQCRERRYRPCSNGHGRTPPQRCTPKAGKRFTFATGQCRESPPQAL